jgi:hypothetical protein
MVYGDNDFTEFTYFIFRIEGDSTVNGVDYKKVYRFDNPDLSQPIDKSEGYLYTLLREDIPSRKVYQGPTDFFMEFYNNMLCTVPETEELLYDFDLTVGDTIRNCDGESAAKITQEIISSRYGMERRIIHPGSIRHGLIEGIGSGQGLFNVGIKSASKGNSFIDFCIGDIKDCFVKFYTESTGYFTEGNKQWNQFSSDNSGQNYPVKYRLEEKLEYRDGFYKRILVSENETSNAFSPTDFSIREAEHVVYLRDRYFDRVLYNFNLEVGDTMLTFDLNFNGLQYVATDVDSIDIYNERRKAITVRCLNDDTGSLYGTYTWVEGIGDIENGLLAPMYGCRTDYNSTLLCYYEDDEIKYANPDYNVCWTATKDIYIRNNLEVYPNPVTNQLFIKNVKPGESYRIVDQLGRTISTGRISTGGVIEVSQFPAGIYFLQIGHKDHLSQTRFVKL